MSLEIIGLLTILLGAVGVYLGPRWSAAILAMSLLFGAAAAIQLPALGGNSVQPSHLLLLFLFISVAVRPAHLHASLASLAHPGPGYWFAAYIMFSVATAYFLPRIFADASLVYSSARGANSMMSTLASPLRPGSSNFTQSVYLLADLACFAIVAALARNGHARFLTHAVIATAATCCLFALLDVTTYYAGVPQALDVIRNANYTMHTTDTFAGFKRIVGSFPEASSFGAIALSLFVFTLILWLERYPVRWLGPITCVTGISLLLCTSTTAYAAGAVMTAVCVLFCLVRVWRGRARTSHATFLLLFVLVLPCLLLGLMLMPAIWQMITDVGVEAFSNKLGSQSGEERTAWNTLALISFLDTVGMGAGLGSVRASSFVVALLSNVGIIGTLLFLLFLYRLLRATRRLDSKHSYDFAIGMAALMSSLSQIVAAALAGTSTDLGLLFSLIAGLAAGISAPRARTSQAVLASDDAGPAAFPEGVRLV
ncbi:hypothetical protein ACSV9I_08745 [Rhizobium sp. G187]|uniref:hypothetical protein n=1 Tax=unclassified Rhizobium TaxID=2613769 RepID=UPI0006B9BF3E|nr:hypothetical protein [Rhizobium sp. AAP43]KPF41894.1 hypothetical protein IP76_18920 [Rhizobium sp. AAP43]